MVSLTTHQKLYTGLCVLFATMLVLVNLTYQKFVLLALPAGISFELSVGAIVYPVTFLLSDLITEFYGKVYAAFCVRLALIMNIIVAGLISLMNGLPATTWSNIDDATFSRIFGGYSIAFGASIIACYFSQRLDIFLYTTISRWTRGRYLWLRNNGSTTISLFVDTCVVLSILGFFDIVPAGHFQSLLINSYAWKFWFTVAGTPLFYALVWFIGKILNREQPPLNRPVVV